MRLYGVWRVTIPDEQYEFRIDDVTVSDQLLLESELDGVSFDSWLRQIDEGRGEACQILIWYLRRLAGRQEERQSVNFPLRRLRMEQIEEPYTEEHVEPGEASAGSEPATESPSSEPTESDPSTGTG